MIAPSPIRDSGRLTVVADDRSELSIRPVAMPADPVVVKHIDFRGRDVTVTLDSSANVRGLALHTSGNKVAMEANGPSIFSTTLPELPERFRTHGERQWKLLAKTTEGNDVDVYHASVDYLLPGTSCVRLAAHPAGKVRLAQRFRRVTVTGATNDRDRLLIIGRIDPPEKLKVVLKSSEQTIEPDESALHADGSFTAVYDLTATGPEGGKVAALAGGYHLKYRETPNHPESWARAAGKLAIRPVDCFTEWNTLRVEGRNSGAVSVTASPPWALSERTKYGRFKLRKENWGPLTNGIVFESYNGKAANDNPRALFDAIHEATTDIPLYWSVRDRRVDVPIGGIPVVEGTAEWHRAMATSRVWINNNNFPHFVSKQSGQFYLQTWHGTPIKKLSNDIARRKVPNTYRRLMRKEAEQWDLLLAQSTSAAENLRSGLGYAGEMKIVEYPRNKRLINGLRYPDLTRERLKIREDLPVVLYLPTWRESGGNFSDELEAGYDLAQKFESQIEANLIIRAHHMTNFRHAKYRNWIEASREAHVEDLLAVADILITDYSSVHYDFKLTGRPTVFYEPDLDAYAQARGFYVERSERQPVANSTTELIELCSAILSKAEHLQKGPHDTNIRSIEARLDQNIADLVENIYRECSVAEDAQQLPVR